MSPRLVLLVGLLWRLARPHLRDRPHRLSAPHRTPSCRVGFSPGLERPCSQPMRLAFPPGTPRQASTVAMGVNPLESANTSSELVRRRTSSPSSRSSATLRRTSPSTDAPHVAVKHPALGPTVAIGVTMPEDITTVTAPEGEATPTPLVTDRTSSSPSPWSRCPEGCRSRQKRSTSP